MEIVIAAAILVGALLLLAASRPSSFRVHRTTLIQARPETVYAILQDFRKFGAWSPWEKLDPAMTKTCSGQGQGAVYEWEGNRKAGAGRMEITAAVAPSRITIQLDFFRPIKNRNLTEFILEGQDHATLVTWTMEGPQSFIGKMMGLFVNLERMIGSDFEAGLANLRDLAQGDGDTEPALRMPTLEHLPPIQTPASPFRHLPTIARILLGLLFFITGLNGFLNFLPQPKAPMPEGAAALAGAMMKSGYLFRLVMATQLVSGALLLSNRFVPLALALLAPVVVNILAFHVFLAPSGTGLAIVVVALELYLAWAYRKAFRPMLAPKEFPTGH